MFFILHSKAVTQSEVMRNDPSLYVSFFDMIHKYDTFTSRDGTRNIIDNNNNLLISEQDVLNRLKNSWTPFEHAYYTYGNKIVVTPIDLREASKHAMYVRVVVKDPGLLVFDETVPEEIKQQNKEMFEKFKGKANLTIL